MKVRVKMSKKKTMVLIVGASGSGKTNLIERTFNKKQVLRSTITRPMRPDEQMGVNYLFTTTKDFKKRLHDGEFIQHAHYQGNYYGVSKREARNKLTEFDTVVVAVVMPTVKDFQAYCQANNVNCIAVFCNISKSRLLAHFANRKESQTDKDKRIANYEKEQQNIQYFDDDHILDMNPDDFGVSARRKLLALIQKENA